MDIKTGANQITMYAYDLLDKVKTITDPLGYTTQYGFDAEHAVIDAADAEENNTHYDYDERDLLWKVTDAEDGVTKYSYTPNGKIYTIADADNNVTTYEYDGFDRLKKVTYPGGSYEQYGYDACGNTTSFRNRAGQTITFGYDALNRLVRKTRPGESDIILTYDIGGNMVDVTQSTSQISYAYNGLGRLESTLDQNNHPVGYLYDDMGRRTQLTYPDGTYIKYEYDIAGRLEYIKDQAGYPIVHYDYDDLGRTTAVNYFRSGSFVGSMEYDYQDKIDANNDNLGNRIERIDYCCNPSHSISYTYDNVGNILTADVGGNYGWTFGYDNIYQVTDADQASRSPQRNVDFSYDSVYNRTLWTDTWGSLNVGYQNNALHQYTRVGSTTPTYDNNGNITSGYGDGLTLTYDCENRLTTADNVSYTYDLLGRRISRTYGVSTNTIYYVYDGDHIIAEYYDTDSFIGKKYIYGPGIDNPVAMIYCIDSSADWFYYYTDALGSVRLLTLSSGVVGESYTYDPMGNRVWRQSTVGGVTTTRKYVVDINGQLPVILCEIDTTTSSLKTSYIYADGQILSQRIHTDPEDPNIFTPYFYVHDRLGSIRLVINSFGSAVNSYTYKPYGAFYEGESIENVENPWAFTGQYYDREIGQYYLRARQYDPTMMRFTGRDAATGQYSSPMSLHKYLYCQNEPIDYMDRTGLWKEFLHRSFGNLGMGRSDDPFDYARLDILKPAWFLPNLPLHFKTKKEASKDILGAIGDGDPREFEFGVHEWQDTYTHRDKGNAWGHLDPRDDDYEGNEIAFQECNRTTMYFEALFLKSNIDFWWSLAIDVKLPESNPFLSTFDPADRDTNEASRYLEPIYREMMEE